jgi:hypothetical protein
MERVGSKLRASKLQSRVSLLCENNARARKRRRRTFAPMKKTKKNSYDKIIDRRFEERVSPGKGGGGDTTTTTT